jgi:hypothetical protein
MAEVKSYKCDECGVQKMESNHWVLARIEQFQIALEPWDDNKAQRGFIHLCGEGCTAKIVSRQIQAWRAQ